MKSKRASARATFERWNRRLHFHVGLFLLFFVWLFALSGLLLNHSSWTFAEYWKNRHETTYERPLVPFSPEIQSDLAQAQEIMRQLGITGEILWTITRPGTNQFQFQVRCPKHYIFLNANLAQRNVSVRDAEVNRWGVLKALHTFSGVQRDDPRNRRDWPLTSIWAFSMDVVAAGLIFMVMSSIYMWLRLPDKRLSGAIALGLGTVSCAFFCVGLRWVL